VANQPDPDSVAVGVHSQGMPMAPRSSRGGLDDEVSLVALTRALLEYRRLFAVIPIAVMLVAVLASIFVPTKYVATASFVPGQGSSNTLPGSIGSLTGLAGLAGQLGAGLSSEASQSPQFYASLIRSRSILEKLLLSRFPKDSGSADSVPLIDLMQIRGPSVARRVENGLTRLANDVSVDVDNRTTIVKVSAKAPTPMLAAALVNRIVADVGEFNLHTRQSQARMRRQFVEQRVSEAREALAGAESALRTFYQRNREWRNSPSLFFEEGRLRRNADVQQELYLNLQRQYEAARIAEINDVPVITVIDSGIAPVLRAQPRRAVSALVGFIAGLALATLAAITLEYTRRMRAADGAEYSRLREAWLQARREFPWIVRRTEPRTPPGR